MKKARYTFGILAVAIIALAACQNETGVTGMSLDSAIDLTIFSSRRLKPAFEPSNATNKKVTWTSSAPDVVSVSANGTITALKYTDAETGTGQAEITATSEDGGFTSVCAVTATMAAQEGILDLPPLKDSFKKYFMMGNIFDPPDVPDAKPYTINKEYITRHYNILTHQNNMKPAYLCGPIRGQYNADNIATAKRMIDAALAKGIKVQGHCLLWHSQIPVWQSSLRTSSDTSEEVLNYLREYVTHIVTEFKDKIYAWDVINEAFRDGVSATGNWRNSMRNSTTDGNPWLIKLGADFVYEGFLAARLADPKVILYYNDYNLDNAGKATMVRDMVRDVNAKYALEYPEAKGRLLIEGIGMQSHHNSGVSAAAVRSSLNLFRPLGVKISISEMDVLAQSYGDYEARRPVIIPGLLNQANQYGEYFKVFIANADIIERVTFWGHSDSYSWRGRGLPTPFDADYKAKPAYYKMIEALEMK
jgi:GH35 family endo-1,4-beta-xylanase